MSHKLLKRPQALVDIEECFEYLLAEDIDTALKFYKSVSETIKSLRNYPFVGRHIETDDLSLMQIRYWPIKHFERYLIYYLATEETVEVIRLLHTARLRTPKLFE